MKYLLDTNIVSYALRGMHNVNEKILSQSPEDICISSITEAELWYGVKKRNSAKLKKLVKNFIAPIAVLPFESAAAEVYADITVKLEAKGTPLDMPDLMIAAIAIANNITLITANTKHFKRIINLNTEDWKTY